MTSRHALPGDDKEKEGDGNKGIDEDDEAVHEGGVAKCKFFTRSKTFKVCVKCVKCVKIV